MTTPMTTQVPGIQGMQQQGYIPGFPPPLGLEQNAGFGQPFGGQQSGGQQFGGQQFGGQPFGGQQMQPQMYGQLPSYGQTQGSGHAQGFGQAQGSPQVQQAVQSVVSQLLPIAYQVILPQVVAITTHQIQQHLQQLVGWQLTGGQQQSGAGGFRPWGF